MEVAVILRRLLGRSGIGNLLAVWGSEDKMLGVYSGLEELQGPMHQNGSECVYRDGDLRKAPRTATEGCPWGEEQNVWLDKQGLMWVRVQGACMSAEER